MLQPTRFPSDISESQSTAGGIVATQSNANEIGLTTFKKTGKSCK